MSTINKKPFIKTLLESLDSELLNTLSLLIDGSGNRTPILRTLSIKPSGNRSNITAADEGVKLCNLEANFSLYDGYLIYTDDYCILIAFTDSQKLTMFEISDDRLNFATIDEELSVTELRSELKDIAGGGGSGDEGDEIVLDLSSINIVDTSKETNQRIYITDENALEQLTDLKKYINNPNIIKPVWLKIKDSAGYILALEGILKYADVDLGNAFTISATIDTYILNIDVVFRPRFDEDHNIIDWYFDSLSVSYTYLDTSYIINSLIYTQELNISANQYNAYISIHINDWEIYYETNAKDKPNIESYVDAWETSMCGAIDYAVSVLGLTLPTTTMENIDSNLKSVLDAVSIAQQEAVGALLLLVGAGVPNDLICASMHDNTTGLVYQLIPAGTLDGQQVYTLGPNGVTNASDILKDAIISDNEVSVDIGYN